VEKLMPGCRIAHKLILDWLMDACSTTSPQKLVAIAGKVNYAPLSVQQVESLSAGCCPFVGSWSF